MLPIFSFLITHTHKMWKHGHVPGGVQPLSSSSAKLPPIKANILLDFSKFPVLKRHFADYGWHLNNASGLFQFRIPYLVITGNSQTWEQGRGALFIPPNCPGGLKDVQTAWRASVFSFCPQTLQFVRPSAAPQKSPQPQKTMSCAFPSGASTRRSLRWPWSSGGSR